VAVAVAVKRSASSAVASTGDDAVRCVAWGVLRPALLGIEGMKEGKA